MRHGWLVGVALVVILGAGPLHSSNRVQAQAAAPLQWVWLPEAQARVGYFRKAFATGWPADEAVLDITANGRFTAWLNGTEVGRGSDGHRVYHFDVTRDVRKGSNVLAVRAETTGKSAGLLVRLGYVPNGQSRVAVVSDGSWKCSPRAGRGWDQPGFDDRGWSPVQVLGPYGAAPWGRLAWDAGGDGRFTVPPGFRVEQAVANPNPQDPFSLLNLAFDGRGRLFVAQENGPVLLCTDADAAGLRRRVVPFCTQVHNCQGMCWVGDALYLVGDGPQGTDLYRVRDTRGSGRGEEVWLLHKFVGGMGEHGPHAVLHGPDGYLYLVVGNGAWAHPERLAANSPLTRWPHGQQGADQGRPGSAEDVLLPRLDEAHGIDRRTLAPGGTIWRLDREGRELSLVTAGLRNAYDAAFTPDGELFTFDSDMEWDEGLPWYRPVRICHCPPGADYLWRDGSANTPDYYLDSLPSALDTGRGSPVGMVCYQGTAFPRRYRGQLFMGDWALGVIYAVQLERHGATYRAKAERFCQGTPMNVTDLAVGPDGALTFTMGGRGSRGGVYRIVFEGAGEPASPAAETAAEARARAVWQMGVRGGEASRQPLLAALADEDPLVRRRACEALIRSGHLPPAAALWPLLGEDDRFLATAARLVLQRLDAAGWAGRLWDEPNDRIVRQGIVALCKTDQAERYAAPLFDRLLRAEVPREAAPLRDHLRTLELALIHTTSRPPAVRRLAERCSRLFPHTDDRANRELAILLTYFRREGFLNEPVHERLLRALQASGDRVQQIHYFYCLRLLHEGWTPAQKQQLLAWYDGTRDWRGGYSFALFLENILREWDPVLTSQDRRELVADGDRRPWATRAVLQMTPADSLPPAGELAALYGRVGADDELREVIVAALGRSGRPEARRALRGLADRDPARREAVARALAQAPAAEDWPYLLTGLDSANPLVVFDVLCGLERLPRRPELTDPAPFRAVLAASRRLDARNRWKAVQVLRHWTGKQFGAEEGAWREELAAWGRWFVQTFPGQPAPPDVEERPAASRYRFEELRAFLEKDPAGRGDAARGRLVFARAQCAKCHRHGRDGDAVGPDLTTVAGRFKRADILEAIVYPSKAISDQYRSTVFVTRKGLLVTGLATPRGEDVSVLQSDGTRVTLKKSEIEQQYASLVSVMPERLLDGLSKAEIADLFAFLESGPK